MSVPKNMTHPPEIVLSNSLAREPIRQRIKAVGGPAEVDFVEPRQLAIGGPAGEASLFLELGEDLIGRLDTALTRLAHRNEAPVVALTRQLPARFQHPSQHVASLGPDGPVPDSAPAGIVIFDTRMAERGIGVVVPAQAALSARLLWVCEESVTTDPYEGLSDAVTRSALAARAKHGRDADLDYEADEVLRERHNDRPGWQTPGGGFGRVRAGLGLPNFRALPSPA